MSEIFLGMQRQINALAREVERLRAVETSSTRWEGTIANGATANPFDVSVGSGGTFAGAFLVVELTGGSVGYFITGGTNLSEIIAPLGNYSTAIGTPASINVYLDANYNVTIQNNLTSRLFYVIGQALRAQN